MARLSFISIVLILTTGCDAVTDRQADANKGGSGRRRKTVMFFSLPGCTSTGVRYTRVSDPVNLDREAREFLTHSSVAIGEPGLLATILIDRMEEAIVIHYLAPDRSRGWVVDMDSFGHPRSSREARQVDLGMPMAPSPAEPIVLLSRLDRANLPLEDLDAAARHYLSLREPEFDLTRSDKVFRIYFEEDTLDALTYLEDDGYHGIAVRFTRDGTPVGHAFQVEPD